ncbi:hypothetical protein [Pontibacter sp. H249]|uniref:hypothetical protein n=1 Tax=Pontibacter sp. H249 TaxID=3133420 RepID=UPI0030C61B14
MNFILGKGVLVLTLALAMASCSSSKKSSDGRIIVIDGKNVRSGNSHKDNGLHKGWYKNTNNPHHPRTTNPGHTKQKAKSGGKPHGKGNSHGKKK